MTSDIVFSVSVQQTGTWFLLNLIKRHPQVHSLQHIGNYFEKIDGCCGRQFLESIVDMWFDDRIWSKDGPRDFSHEVGYRFISSIVSPPVGKKILLHSHLSHGDGKGHRKNTLNPTYPSFHGVFLQQLMSLYKTVIPIRDPLRSLLTRQNRHPKLDHRYLIDGFKALARCHDVFFFPVDLFEKYEDRRSLLVRLFEFLELEVPKYVNEVAKSWVPANTSGHYEMKDWYNAKDAKKIEKIIPEEYEWLRKNISILKPFLESLGYRNLMWWR